MKKEYKRQGANGEKKLKSSAKKKLRNKPRLESSPISLSKMYYPFQRYSDFITSKLDSIEVRGEVCEAIRSGRAIPEYISYKQ